MRLIDTKTRLLLEPWKAAGKDYAILSHTWGDQEVIFQEWEQLYPSGAIRGQCPHVRHQGIDKKAGYFKVMQACEQAQRDGFRYLWCDTMCINKESSAELSEAINSMFKWYRDAKVCYVYLTDVTLDSKIFRGGVGPSLCTPNHSNVRGLFDQVKARQFVDVLHEMESWFMASRWWTRGWTLQELLAPKNVAFFTQDWTLLGHKSSLAPFISASTRIHKEALQDHTTIQDFSIAQRMSWAANRTTTVVEDMAYCLLGIFEINMPMLYGQGDGAFQKLQHEIIKASDDQSIFAWTSEPGDSPWTGALAPSPRCFQTCGSIVREPGSLQQPYSLTNVGFKMRVPMIASAVGTHFFVGLDCFLELHGKSQRSEQVSNSRRRIQIWVPMRKRGDGGLFERIHTPASHVYLQSSYPWSKKILRDSDIYLLEHPFRKYLDNVSEVANVNGSGRSGIVVAVGFGNMSMVSQAYKEIWQPRGIEIMSVGYRRPRHSSHQAIISGKYCIILSVVWDEHGRPSMNKHTTLYNADSRKLPIILDELNRAHDPEAYSNDVNAIHQNLREAHQKAFESGQSAEAPTIIVEDEPLYDMHQFAYVMVDVIFKEKRISDADRKQTSYDFALA